MDVLTLETGTICLRPGLAPGRAVLGGIPPTYVGICIKVASSLVEKGCGDDSLQTLLIKSYLRRPCVELVLFAMSGDRIPVEARS